MASITGMTSSSILSSMSSGRLTGLASGLDTDSLIENMTAGTRSKIAQMQQKQTKAQWQMDAYRSISSKLIAFQNKFTSYTSSTNLRSAAFYSKSSITSAGNADFSKYVKASGNGDKLGTATIAGVKQLATKTSYVSAAGSVSKSTLTSTEAIDSGADVKISKLAGQSITLKYGSKSVDLTLSKEADYKTLADVEKALADALKEADYDDKIKMTFNQNGQLMIDYASDEVKKAGNTIEVKSVSSAFGDFFGIEKGDKTTGSTTITGEDKITEKKLEEYVGVSSLAGTLADKSLTFSYNGKSATIELGSLKELTAKSEDNPTGDVLTNVQKQLQKQLDAEYGSGRVTVGLNGGKLSFSTTYPDGSADKTSTLTLSSGDSEALNALKLKSGMSNRLNTDAKLNESGFNFKNGWESVAEADKDYSIHIVDKVSGQRYVIDQTVSGDAFSADTTIDEIIEAINASDAKVKVTYLSTSDQLSITSTQEGASGDFAIVGTDAEFNAKGGLSTLGGDNLGTALFGRGIKGMGDDYNGMVGGVENYSVTKGQDAVVYVDYDGEGGADPVEMRRSSNTFDLNGVNITVSGVFNMVEAKDENGNVIMENGKPKMVLDKAAEDVSFESKADVEKITEAFKEMITAYNEIIELANKMVSEKPNRDFAPLTDEQKEEMSEEEIEKWEEKAKTGLLFNDSDLRAFTNEIRFLFEGDSATVQALKDMGITTSSSYSANGKVEFNEEAFKNALETNLDGVKQIFTSLEETKVNADGKEVVLKKGGIMNQIENVFDKYAAVDKATKGVFIQMAGAIESPISMLDNFLQKQMDEFDDVIKTLQDKLEDEAERYYKQFSNLEVYINNMNSQSSWLYSQMGGY